MFHSCCPPTHPCCLHRHAPPRSLAPTLHTTSPPLLAEPQLARSMTSPMTGAALAAPTLIPNRAPSQALEAWRQQQVQQLGVSRK